MAVDPSRIKDAIAQKLPDAEIEIEDLVGDKNHFRVTVRSNAFDKLSRIAQHQLVYRSLGNMLDGDLHALSIVTQTKTAAQ